MKKKNIVIVLSLLVLAALILSVDTKHYIYSYYRIINGDFIEARKSYLSPGFFFYKKNVRSGNFIVFNRDIDHIPLYIDTNQKNIFLPLLNDEKIEIRLKKNDCTVYEDKTTPKNIYLVYESGIHAILGVDNAAENELLILCGMLDKNSKQSACNLTKYGG